MQYHVIMNKNLREKNIMTNYYSPGPIYVASYEEDAPNLVDNLILTTALKEQRNSSKRGENKKNIDRRDLIEIKDDEDKLESDWDSDYSY